MSWGSDKIVDEDNFTVVKSGRKRNKSNFVISRPLTRNQKYIAMQQDMLVNAAHPPGRNTRQQKTHPNKK